MKKNNCHLLPNLIVVSFFLVVQHVNGQTWNPSHKIGTSTGVDHFSYSQTPAQLVEIYPAGIPNTGLTYQWEQSPTPISGFSAISGATSSSYSFSGPLSQTTYYRRKTTNNQSQYIYSNVVKISVVSTNWEDINYIREHDVLTTGVTTWTSVDQLSIGDKLQTTTYLDGLGRGTEKISRGSATPSQQNGTWGDMVQFSQYDAYGRQPLRYLPYTTTTQSGKYKTTSLTEQPQYYTNNYSETYPYSSITFDVSPLDRVTNVKQPGTSWAAGSGSSVVYDLNTSTDDVKIFGVDYAQGNPPVYLGAYAAKSLYKVTYSDENGKQVVEYLNKSGQLILKKVQLDNSPSSVYAGWICTYNIYDDFGLLRYQIQPEGVKYLSNNSWSFAGSNGATILSEQCFQYYLDDKGRTTWKKSPGADPLRMIYDIRDRLVFMQDGKQAQISTPQWTTNLYDELDRPTISTLYNTSKTVSQLQSDINNASSQTTVTITNSGSYSVTATLHLSPLSSTNLNSSSTCTVLKYVFYDDYTFNAVKSFNTNFTNTSAYSNSDPNVIPIATTARTISMSTGSMTRVLGSTTFLSETKYYDERGSHIQRLEDNIKGGADVTTLQYHFDGRLLSTCNDHTAPGTDYSNFITLTKYIFDQIGRVSSIQKQFGSNSFKTISFYDYDDVGRIKTKHLDPGYTAGGNADLESLDYSYNIHNQITGINKDYALKNPSNYDKWGHFFGLYLGFDNRDNVFTNGNLTGQVTGALWNTQGDDAQRKYDYTYDNAGRFIKAIFKEKQHTGDSWSNSMMDFTVQGSSNGNITYDLNGNLLNMLQKGVMPGTGPIIVDELTYQYQHNSTTTQTYSNRLDKVSDAADPSINGSFGDFKDGGNGSNPDYVYDQNGNLVIDLNKDAKDLGNVTGADGIRYNYLDKPEEIHLSGKGTIQITYSADGEKLKRTFTPEGSGDVITTYYINQFIYQETNGSNTVLQLMNFEEGRIRVISPTSQGNGLDALIVNGNMDLPNGARGAYDYFIMDYQQNVRMILTEEDHEASNTCSMEDDDSNRAALEESLFGQQTGDNEVRTSRQDAPSGWTNSNIGRRVSELGKNYGIMLGPNTLQKVMAGDKVSAIVQYYWQNWPANNTTGLSSTVLASIASAITSGNGVSSLIKNNSSQITTQLGNVSGFVNAVEPTAPNPKYPYAYLTILFFDERFNFIEAADGGVAQQQVNKDGLDADGSRLVLVNVKAPKNGYVFVYISNVSDESVYFDNLQVGIVQGNIAEENHYYPYGLTIATLSSKKLGDSYEGSLKNRYLFNDKELFDDADLDWYDYGFRNYDPQIGRFPQLDPLTFQYQFLTPYQYASCDPITNIDVDGLEGGNSVNGVKEIASHVSDVPTGALATMKAIENVVVTAVRPATSGIGRAILKGAVVSLTRNLSVHAPNILFVTKPVSLPMHVTAEDLVTHPEKYDCFKYPKEPKVRKPDFWEDGGDGGGLNLTQEGASGIHGRHGTLTGKDGEPIPIDGFTIALSMFTFPTAISNLDVEEINEVVKDLSVEITILSEETKNKLSEPKPDPANNDSKSLGMPKFDNNANVKSDSNTKPKHVYDGYKKGDVIVWKWQDGTQMKTQVTNDSSGHIYGGKKAPVDTFHRY